MKQFLKFTFASCLGVGIAFIVFFFFFFIIIGALISSADQQGATPIASDSFLEIKLSQQIPEQTNNTAPSGFTPDDVVGSQDMQRLIRNAADDSKIKGIYINTEMAAVGSCVSSDLLSALEDFKLSGKPVVAYGNYFNQMGYKIASAADHIILNPAGGMEFRGFGIMSPFFKTTLNDVGIDMQVFYAGDYKGATEPYRRNEYSAENREQLSEYIHTSHDLFLEEIARNRGMDVANLRNISRKFLVRLPEDALKYDLVDAIGYNSDALTYLKEASNLDADATVNMVSLHDYYQSKGNLLPSDGKDKIAVLYAEGEIIDGKNQPGQIAEKDYIKYIRQIKGASGIKALVMRVNSPGGSGLTSDVLLHELDRIQAEGIPIIVSMGEYAASGGYYISAHADRIVASPNTLTGSIGVYGVIPNIRGLVEGKMGITFDTIGTSKYATRMNLIYAFDDEESAILQNQIDHVYNRFLKIVSEGRGMPIESVHKIAQGRVWTGEKALELGLVDTLGSLNTAIQVAADYANLDSYKVVEYPYVKNRFQQIIEMYLGDDAWTKAGLKSELGVLYPAYDKIKTITDSDGPMMRLPFIMNY